MMDTIFALASAPGKAGVSVLRVSGPLAHRCVRDLTSAGSRARGMSLRALKDETGNHLDDALVLSFHAPASFTGEDVAELHLHGSVAIVSSVLAILSNMDGLRLAFPGEFTRRAMENGKLDLAQVEGLADLIEAETEAQRKQAQAVFGGDLGKLAENWRKDLIRAASLIEATIDFADEEVPTDIAPEVMSLINRVTDGLEKETIGIAIAERVRSGFEVAIVGAPNVGKSTLINSLAGRQAAITSEFAGTTRDVIEVRMDLDGLAVTVLDTAGLRNTDDHVEGLGISLARQRAEQADLRVFLLDSNEDLYIPRRDGDILVRAKADIRTEKSDAVSGLTGEGVSDLVGKISSILRQRSARAGIATRERHRVAMDRALGYLLQAVGVLLDESEGDEIAAEDIRSAIRSLESLVGRVDVENLLDEIFSSFCLGK